MQAAEKGCIICTAQSCGKTQLRGPGRELARSPAQGPQGIRRDSSPLMPREVVGHRPWGVWLPE